MRSLAPLLFALLAFSTSSFAQSPPAVPDHGGAAILRGRVLDPSRAPIKGASITAVLDGQPSVFTAATNGQGEFLLTVAPGRYTVAVVATGFSSLSREASAGPAGEPLDFVLQLAGVQETVTVTAPDYTAPEVTTSTKTTTPLRDVPQSVTVVTKELMRDQLMLSVPDVVRYVPGMIAHQGENNRDQVIIRGNNSTADFFVDGVRDDAQYQRDLYNLERVEALKGPNAMIFGRGGGGGLINRVTKSAFFAPMHELVLQGGTYGHKRFSSDFNQRLTPRVALRFNGVYEDSASFRQGIGLERYGLSPTLTITPDARTTVSFSYERFHDARDADRGVPSFDGRPATPRLSTVFGNPQQTYVRAQVDLASAVIERRLGAWTLRNRTSLGDYDRAYQNFVPGAVTADRSRVALTAYNNASQRLNLFNQTDLTGRVSFAGLRHTLLAGAEAGRQVTDNLRNTGYFNNSTTSTAVPFDEPAPLVNVTFRQSATDADNRVRAAVAAVYAQDQIEVSRFVQVVTGLRVDRFDLRYRNNRNGDALRRVDDLISPRAGVVIKPFAPLSLYGGYTVSYLPSSGDQFAALTKVDEQIKPEKFHNYEAGAKWDIVPGLSFTSAAYRLDRTNTRAADPNDPTKIVQTGSQRTNGYELGLNGRVTRAWQIAGGYAYQHAFITSATSAAKAGATIAQVPRHTFALWNSYQLHPRLGAALGVVRRSDMFAAIDNKVTLPGYTKLDAALYLSLSRQLRVQANIDNVTNRRYFVNANGNNTNSPGWPRTLRVALITRF